MTHHNGTSTPTSLRPRSFAEIFPHHTEQHQSLVANAVERLVHNWAGIRRDLQQFLLPDPRRSIPKECGWPETITPELYQQEYDRNFAAGRVVEIWPEECWQVQPNVYEDEDPDVQTPFELAWDELNKSLAGRKSWHAGEEGSLLWSYLREADIKSRIGRYGIILLGLDDGLPLDQPAAGVEESNSGTSVIGNDGKVYPYRLAINAKKTKNRKLLYLRTLPESLAWVSKWETNESSQRHCQPVEYAITLYDPSTLTDSRSSVLGLPSYERRVHWTRVIHISESDILHVPPLQCVFNNVVDVVKVLGADAEACWKQGQAKMILEAADGAEFDPNELRDELEKYFNGQDPALILRHLTAKNLPPGVSNPAPHVQAQLQAIAVKVGVPLRILLGSEEGKQAADQDAKRWKRRVGKRRKDHCSPRIIQPFADRLIMLGVLPEPKQYTVYWDDLETLSGQEQASLALSETQAIAAFEKGCQNTITAKDWWVEVVGKTEEVAENLVKNAEEEKAKREEEAKQKQEQAMLDQAIKGIDASGLGPDGKPPIPGIPPHPDVTSAGAMAGNASATTANADTDTLHPDVPQEDADDDPTDPAELIAEILYGLFGTDAATYFGVDVTPTSNAKWNPLDHPRGENGRFIPRGSAEAVSTAKDAISRALKGEKSSASAKDLAAHLSILTTKQLREIHREHGAKPVGRLKEDLVAAIRASLPKDGGGKGSGETKADEVKAKTETTKKTEPPAKSTPADVARAYGDGVPSLDLTKPPLKLLQQGDRELLLQMSKLIPPGDAEGWFGEDPTSWPRIKADSAVVDHMDKATLQKLVDRGFLSKSTVHSLFGLRSREEYGVTLTAKQAQTALRYNLGELKMPKTRDEVNAFARDSLAGLPEGVAAPIRDYLGVERQNDLQGYRDKLNEMLYRSYNPVPVWERVKNDAALQEKVKKVADLAGKDTTPAAQFEVKKEIHRLTNRIQASSNDVDRLGEQIEDAKRAKDAKEVKRLESLLDDLGKQMDADAAKLGELYKKQSSVSGDRPSDVVSKLLAVPNPTAVKVASFDPGHNQKEKDAVEQARAWLQGKVQQTSLGDILPAYNVIKDESDRVKRGHPSAYYSVGNNAINVHAGMTSVGTNVHEMAHGIEYKIPGVQSAANRFLNYRVKDEPLRTLKEVLPDAGYASWEQGRKDDFEKSLGKYGAWYAGKKALGDGATEVVSMGVEELHRDPSGFARKDPEFAGFIMGILDGSIRDRAVP